MVMNFAVYDINLHMIHHNKKVNSAKPVVNTSPPRSYRQRSNISNLHSRFSTPTLSICDAVPSRANSNCDVRRRKCSSFKNEERSSSVPPRPPTRRKPNVQPQNYLKTENNFPKITDSFNKKIPLRCESPKRNLDNNKSPTQIRKTSPVKTPVPTPREFSGISKLPNVPEHEYLQFALRITEDIIRNDLYTQKEMRRVFNSHIEANRGRLNMNKMLEQIDHLCNALNLSKKSQDQNMLKKKVPCSCKTTPKSTISANTSKENVLKKIVQGEYSITEKEIQELNEKDLEEVLSTILNDDIYHMIATKSKTDEPDINLQNIAVDLEAIERDSNDACRDIIEDLLKNVNQEISDNEEILSKIAKLKAESSLSVEDFVMVNADNLQPEKNENYEYGDNQLNDIEEIEEEEIDKVDMENEVCEVPTINDSEKLNTAETNSLRETIVTSIISDILKKVEDNRTIKNIVEFVESSKTKGSIKSLDEISVKSVQSDNKCTQTSFLKTSVYEYDNTGVFHVENEKKCPDCEPTCVKNTENDFIAVVEKSIQDQTKNLYEISPQNDNDEIDKGCLECPPKESNILLEDEVITETTNNLTENNEEVHLSEENNLESEVVSSPEDLPSESKDEYTTEYMDRFSIKSNHSKSSEKPENSFEVRNSTEKLNQNIDYTQISEKLQSNDNNQENKSTKKPEKDAKNTSSREKAEKSKSPQKITLPDNSLDYNTDYCNNTNTDCSHVIEKFQRDLNKYEIKSFRKPDRNSLTKASKNKTDNLFDNPPTLCKNKRNKQFFKKLHTCTKNCDKDIAKTPENIDSSLSEGEIKYCMKENGEISNSILDHLRKYEQDAKIPKNNSKQLVCICDYELKFYDNKNYRDYVPKFERTIFFPDAGTQTSYTEVDLKSDGEVQNTSSSEVDEL